MTVQSVDHIEYDGETFPFSSGNLEPPNEDPRVPKFEGFLSLPSTMLRGYEAAWALREGRLYLDSIWGEWSIAGDKPVIADWITGEIGIGLGPVIGQEMWGPIYERTLFIDIIAGIVRGTREVRNSAPSERRSVLSRTCES